MCGLRLFTSVWLFCARMACIFPSPIVSYCRPYSLAISYFLILPPPCCLNNLFGANVDMRWMPMGSGQF
ncbi:hypothetical protein J3F83DRAFT_729416 [Trichoderma novae-zelandiae]